MPDCSVALRRHSSVVSLYFWLSLSCVLCTAPYQRVFRRFLLQYPNAPLYTMFGLLCLPFCQTFVYSAYKYFTLSPSEFKAFTHRYNAVAKTRAVTGRRMRLVSSASLVFRGHAMDTRFHERCHTVDCRRRDRNRSRRHGGINQVR